MKILEARNISQQYQGEDVISDINLELHKKEIVCLVGSSGVGKTTLFQILSGLNMPTAGQVLCNDEDVVGKTGRVGYMLQNDLLLPHLNVLKNASISLKLIGTSSAVAKTITEQYLEMFGLSGCGKKFPHQLSGGMRQRVAFLRTFLFSKEVLLLDEPFSALDQITKQEMWNWFLSISNQLSLSTLFISHDIEEAVFLSDRIYVMAGKPGKIVKIVNIDQEERDEQYRLSSKIQKYKKEVLEGLVQGNIK